MKKLFDLHNDYFTSNDYDFDKQQYVSNFKNCNIATVVWTSEFDPKTALDKIKLANKFVSKNSNTFLAIEDLHFLSNVNIDEIKLIKPTYAGLTWNHNNTLAGGAFDNGNLSDYGKRVVGELERNGILVDTAHLNEQSFLDFSKITTKPILCSHTASFAKNNHPRNLKDSQIEIIAKSNGLVGICLVGDFLVKSPQCLIEDYVRHIDYLVCKFGIEHFAIGSDFFGTKNLPLFVQDYTTLTTLLVFELQKLGYTKYSINQILFENANKFFNKK